MSTSTSAASSDWPASRAPAARFSHPIICDRWSPRAFGDHPVTADELTALFEATAWASSAGNVQPWVFVYAHRTNETHFQRLLGCLNEANQAWAQHAAVLLVVFARTTLPDGRPNARARHDVSAATTTLLLQATALGLYGHVMPGFDVSKTCLQFQLPSDVEPVTFATLSHLGTPDLFGEPERTRVPVNLYRKPVSEIAFAGEFPTN